MLHTFSSIYLSVVRCLKKFLRFKFHSGRWDLHFSSTSHHPPSLLPAFFFSYSTFILSFISSAPFPPSCYPSTRSRKRMCFLSIPARDSCQFFLSSICPLDFFFFFFSLLSWSILSAEKRSMTNKKQERRGEAGERRSWVRHSGSGSV